MTAKFIGVIEAEQTEKGETVRNDRLVAVLDTPRNPALIHSLEEFGRERLDGIEYFLIAYGKAEGRTFSPVARHGRAVARKLVEAGAISPAMKGPSRKLTKK